jgi:hypothetical protein
MTLPCVQPTVNFGSFTVGSQNEELNSLGAPQSRHWTHHRVTSSPSSYIAMPNPISAGAMRLDNPRSDPPPATAARCP